MPRPIVPVALLVAFTLVSACQPAGSGRNETAGKPVHCTVIVDGPKKADGAEHIDGRARFRCAEPGATSLTLKIQLQKESGGDTWKTVSAKSYTMTGKSTIAAELKYQTRLATLSCQTGTFRTVVDWTRTSKGNKEGDNLVSGSVKDPCKSLFTS